MAERRTGTVRTTLITAPRQALELLPAMATFSAMKTTILLLLGATVLLTSCRGGGGPAQRAGRGVDNAVNWFGYGVRRTGEGIQRAAR